MRNKPDTLAHRVREETKQLFTPDNEYIGPQPGFPEEADDCGYDDQSDDNGPDEADDDYDEEEGYPEDQERSYGPHYRSRMKHKPT